MTLRIRRDDTVQVLAGRERGKRGKVREIRVDDHKVIVAEINIAKRHMKAGKARQAGIIDIEQPLDLSNVGVVCPKCDRPVRLGSRELESGQRVRTCKRCGEQV